jgi:glucuronate isomerase
VPWGQQIDVVDANVVFKKAMKGKELTDDETVTYMSWLLNEVAELDAEKGWVFQLHMGAVRDVRDSLAESLGPDTGGDVSDHDIDIAGPLLPLLNRFDERLKIVLYCLEPGFQGTLATLTRAFGTMVNLGSAWWFNDTPHGMRTQLEYVSGVDLLSSHAGMVSDSRKILSYGSRHEMFRRVLCDVVGGMVAQGRVPYPVAERLVRRMCYDNPKALFGL